jgi:hypothetical protein
MKKLLLLSLTLWLAACSVATATDMDKLRLRCTTLPSGTVGYGVLACDSATNTVKLSNNNGTFAAITPKFMMSAGSNSTVSAGVTNYLGFTGGVSATASDVNQPIALVLGGTVTAMMCTTDQTPGTSQSYTYTLFVNANSTAATCAETNAQNTCTISGLSVSLSPSSFGSNFASVQVVTSGGATVARHHCSIEVRPS